MSTAFWTQLVLLLVAVGCDKLIGPDDEYLRTDVDDAGGDNEPSESDPVAA